MQRPAPNQICLQVVLFLFSPLYLTTPSTEIQIFNSHWLFYFFLLHLNSFPTANEPQCTDSIHRTSLPYPLLCIHMWALAIKGQGDHKSHLLSLRLASSFSNRAPWPPKTLVFTNSFIHPVNIYRVPTCMPGGHSRVVATQEVPNKSLWKIYKILLFI